MNGGAGVGGAWDASDMTGMRIMFTYSPTTSQGVAHLPLVLGPLDLVRLPAQLVRVPAYGERRGEGERPLDLARLPAQLERAPLQVQVVLPIKRGDPGGLSVVR